MGDHKWHKWQKPGLCPGADQQFLQILTECHLVVAASDLDPRRGKGRKGDEWPGIILKKSSRNLEISKYIWIIDMKIMLNDVKCLSHVCGLFLGDHSPKWPHIYKQVVRLLPTSPRWVYWTIWKPKGIAPTYSAWQAAGRHYLGWRPWSLGIWQCTSCFVLLTLYTLQTRKINLCNQAYQARSLSHHILCPFKTCGTASLGHRVIQEILSLSMEYCAKDWALQKRIEPCGPALVS